MIEAIKCAVLAFAIVLICMVVVLAILELI